MLLDDGLFLGFICGCVATGYLLSKITLISRYAGGCLSVERCAIQTERSLRVMKHLRTAVDFTQQGIFSLADLLFFARKAGLGCGVRN